MNARTDLLARPDRSVLLRSARRDAWHDTHYADVVPDYGRRMSTAAQEATARDCQRLSPLTRAETDQIGLEMYTRVALLLERDAATLSRDRGISACEAVNLLFKPVDALGRAVSDASGNFTNAAAPIAGYAADSFFPVLNHQWTDGPFRLKNTMGCLRNSPDSNNAVRLYDTSWVGCPRTDGTSFGFDLSEVYPAFDAAKCPTSVPPKVTNGSVCIVWGGKIGNDTPGRRGSVFECSGIMSNDSIDAQDRFLHLGQYKYYRDPVYANFPMN